MDLYELKQKRAKIVADQRAMLERAEAANRSLNTEEQESYDRMDVDFGRLGDEIRRAEVESREEYLRQPEGRSVHQSDDTRPAPRGGDSYSFWADTRRGDQRTAFNAMLAGLPVERRALQASDDPAGGYLSPDFFVARLIQGLDDAVFIRKYATVIPVPYGTSIQAPALDNDLGDPTWTTELGTGDEDTTMSFGARELHPHPLARRIKVSNTLLRQARLNPEDVVRQRFEIKFAQIEENGFLNGSGSGQPLGLFTASDDGIPTSRDVSTGNADTSIQADGLLNAVGALKAQYLGNARWIFHRDAVKQIRKLKDGDGQYIWSPGLIASQPDQLLGLPVHQSEYAPNTFTTGQYVGLVGDLTFLWIADCLNMQIQVLRELYAEDNQTGYIGRLECDAMPVLAEAFARVTLG